MKKTIFRRTVSFLLAVLTVLTTLVVVPFTASATEADVTITTPEELLDFITSTVSNSYAGKTIVLANDIDLTGHDWRVPQWLSAEQPGTFSGTFDGQGHNVKITSSHDASGKPHFYMFNVLDGATVKNMSVELSGVTCNANESAIANGTTNGTLIENVYVSGELAYNVSGNRYSGGMVSNISGDTTFKNCVVATTITGVGTSLGGFVGQLGGDVTVTFDNCAFIGSVSTGRRIPING